MEEFDPTFANTRSAQGSKISILRLRGTLCESVLPKLNATYERIQLENPKWLVINPQDTHIEAVALEALLRYMDENSKITVLFCITTRIAQLLNELGFQDIFWEPIENEEEAILRINRLEAREIVRELAYAHAPTDESESQSLIRIRQLIHNAARPFARDHFVPGHLTASAIVVDAPRQHTLLIFHEKLQLWLQPGGHFEPGETDPSVAAAREVLEETQTETRWPGDQPALLDVDVHVIPARKNEPQHEHFDLRMLLIAARDSARAGDGVTQARWVGREEWAPMNLDPGLQRALRKVFS